MGTGLDAVPLAPGHLPFLGHTVALLRDRLGFIASLPGHAGLVRLRFGPHTMVLVCDPGLVQEVLRDDRTFDKGGPFFDRAREAVGNGLATCPHDRHRRQRRLCQPAFRPARLPDYADGVTSAAYETTADWADGQVVDVNRSMLAIANRTLATTMFSSRLPDATTRRIGEDAETLMVGAMRRMLLPAPFDRVPTPGNLRFQRARARLLETVAEVVAAHRALGADHRDLLSDLLLGAEPDGADDGPAGLSDQEVADQVITFFIAGTETTAGLLSWVLYELARHPAVQDRLHAHVTRVLDGGPPRAADVPALTYLGRVLDEALRLHSITWLVTRTVTRATALGGTHLPAGTTVALSQYAVHWNPLVHPRPLVFDPDRWAGRPPDRTSFIPFGSGPRRCIGDRFALQESALVLALLIGSWRFTAVTDRPARTALSAACVPRDLRLRLEARPASPGRP
ncbi:cytochrome P450 [Streptomyces sp. NPDC096136]|uniref:cytochrome P450 n=1 Tax=Streptomyces sp. NPDC096136 TaxID=3366076 RepID=UPI0037FD673F